MKTTDSSSIVKSHSLWSDAWSQLRRNRLAMASIWVIIIYFILALYGESVHWYYFWQDKTPSYNQTNLGEEYLPPSIFRHPFSNPNIARVSRNIRPSGFDAPRTSGACSGLALSKVRKHCVETSAREVSLAEGLTARVRQLPDSCNKQANDTSFDRVDKSRSADNFSQKTFLNRVVLGLRNLADHPLGTDNLGRDVFQRTIQGSRIAFQVGIITSLIAIPIGVILGCLAGYFGGRVDDFIVWLYSTFAAMPGLLFILAIAMVLGKGLTGVYLGIGLTTWVGLCRLIRGEVMKHKNQPYVTAARVLGISHFRIIFRHILPNILHIIIITFSIRFPAAVSTEVFMSFLGIGVQGEPSWGIMISNARLRLWQGIWWEMTFVTLAIFMIVLAFNLFGDALRDALDPRLRTTDR